MTVARRLQSDTAPPAIAMPDETLGTMFPEGWGAGGGASLPTGYGVSTHTGVSINTTDAGFFCRVPGAAATVFCTDMYAAAREYSKGIQIQTVPHIAIDGIKAMRIAAPLLILDHGVGKSQLFQQYQREVMRSQLGALTAPEPYLPLSIAEQSSPEHLIGFEQYNIVDWDGFDASPITKQTLAYARKLMKLLPADLGEPDAAPAADGSIALQWVPTDQKHPLEKLFLDIGPGEEWRAYWTKRDGSRGRQPGTLVNDNTKIILEQLFKKLST